MTGACLAMPGSERTRRMIEQQGEGDRGVEAGVIGRARLREDSCAREQRDGDDDLASNRELETAPQRGDPPNRCLGAHGHESRGAADASPCMPARRDETGSPPSGSAS